MILYVVRNGKWNDWERLPVKSTTNRPGDGLIKHIGNDGLGVVNESCALTKVCEDKSWQNKEGKGKSDREGVELSKTSKWG